VYSSYTDIEFHEVIVRLRRLENFLREAEQGSFTRATSYLAIAQPALSRQPKPSNWGSGRHLLSKMEGKRHLWNMDGAYWNVTRALLGATGEAAGEPVVALPSGVSSIVMAPRVSNFRECSPKIDSTNSCVSFRLCALAARSARDLELLSNDAAQCMR
jgi:hypothetical protein